MIPYDNCDAKILLDGILDRKYRNSARSNLRQAVTASSKVGNTTIKFVDSVNENTVQLADLIAGSINRSLQPEKTDAQDYYNIIKHRIRQDSSLSLSGNNKK